MLAAVLMLNLLVAVFSSTYDNLQNLSGILWKWQRFDLMKEFSERSAIPIPFSSILYMGKFIVYLAKKMLKLGRKVCGTDEPMVDTSVMERLITEHNRVKLLLLESECRRKYLEKQEVPSLSNHLQVSLKSLDKKVQEINEKVTDFELSVQSILDTKIGKDMNLNVASIPTSPSPSQAGSKMLEIMDADDLQVEMEDVKADMAVLGDDSLRNAKPRKSTLVTKPIDTAKLMRMGVKCRNPEYPGSDIRREYVKKEHWDWRHPLLKYKPSYLQFSNVSAAPEPRISDIVWNDCVNGDERRSYEGKYLTQNNQPLNPAGRTGISGKGKLARWGPNYVSIPIISRQITGLTDDAPFEVIMQKDSNDVLLLPEVSSCRDIGLPDEMRELLNTVDEPTEENVKMCKRVNKIIKSGVVIYRGYLDSEYNTDNSWMECLVTSYHDTHNKVFSSIELDANSDYQWYKVSGDSEVDSAHKKFLQQSLFSRNYHD